MLENTKSGENGTTAQAAIAAAMEINGAIRNRKREAFAGRMISFRISLMTSAKGCRSPNGPTRFGPMRTCM